MSFRHLLSRSRAERAPLTEQRMMRILQTHHYTVRFRFGGVFAVDGTAQEYYICPTANLADMTVQHFMAALTTAFSFRVREN